MTFEKVRLRENRANVWELDPGWTPTYRFWEEKDYLFGLFLMLYSCWIKEFEQCFNGVLVLLKPMVCLC